MADVFLSYASEDVDLAHSLADALATRGWGVFWDRTIVPGTTWDEMLEAKLKNCRAVIVLWSPRSVVSRWVRAEAEFAAQHNKLIPLIVDEPVDVPLPFIRIQAGRLTDWKSAGDNSHGFQQLLVALSQSIGSGSTAPVDDVRASDHATLERLRTQFLAAHSSWELSRVLYELEEYMTKHPSPDARLLRDRIQIAIQRTPAVKAHAPVAAAPRGLAKRRGSPLLISIIGALIIAGLLYIVYRVLF